MIEPLGRVAVFWHYDNLPPPNIGSSPRAISHATHDVTFNIRQALYKFGIITSFRAYVGSMPLQTKWELQSHGVTVVECLWNASETMITADMFHFALDNPSLGTTLVLISSSFTLAYTISVLGARRYRVALVSTLDPHNNVLLAQASEVIDWRCLLSRGNTNPPRPPSLPATQNSSATSTPEYPAGMEYNAHAGPTAFSHNVAETLERSFTISDLNLVGSSGGRSASPPSHPTAAQLELQGPPLVDCRPPSRQIEEAILTRPVVEDAEEISGPPCFDSRGKRIDLLIRPFNRSVSEMALGGNAGVMRPRANSLQDNRRPRSPSGNLTLKGPVPRRSLPISGITLPSFEELVSGRPLNVEAPPFIPTPGLKTPPTKPSEDITMTITPPTRDPSPTVEPVEKTPPPSFRLEGSDSTSPTASVSSTATVKPASPVATAMKSGPPSRQGFTKAEQRAVETVIRVLQEVKSKGEARTSTAKLPSLILAKDRAVYRRVGSRGNRFWKLIDLGVQMGWLEAGPENSWIDVGEGWTEETSSRV